MKNTFQILSFILLMGLNYSNCFAQNHALSFDGIDDYIDIPTYTNMSPTNAVTIEAWIKGYQNSNGSTKFIYDRVETNDGYGLTITSSGRARLTINGGTVSVISSINVLDGNWNHIAGTYDKDAGVLYIYVNGEEDGFSTYSSPIKYTQEPRNGIGGAGASSGFFFTGEIGEVRVWNYARSEEELKDNMCSSLDSPGDGLIAYWSLNEGTGTEIIDKSSNSNDGIVIEAEWVDAMYCSSVNLAEKEKVDIIKIYPNPMSSSTTIELNQDNKLFTQVKIINLTGQVIKEYNFNSSNKILIQRGNLNAGIYLIQIVQKNKTILIEKMIIE